MVRKTKKEIVNWDAELAREAEIAASTEANSGGGQFFSLRGGILNWQDAPMPNNEMAIILLDTVFENVFYEGVYDADTPQSPSCFAFGREEKELEPHLIVVEASQAQSTEGCGGCENNEWGSAETGRGKACSNTRRLAMISAGQLDSNGNFGDLEEEDFYQSTQIGFMKLPVMSVKGYASFVKSVAGALKRPPYGIITKAKVVPDPKSQFRVVFEPMSALPDELIGLIRERVEEAKSIIDFPYQLNDEEEAPPPKSRTKKHSPAKKSAVAKKRARKY